MRIPLFIFTVLLAFSTVLAQEQKKTYTTTQSKNLVPEIDGLIDESFWEQVKWENDFIQRIPYEGKAPTFQTSFKVIFDDKNVYVAIMAFDSIPEKINRQMTRRDGYEGDLVSVSFDSYFDHQTAFSFTVSASGVKSDDIVSNDGNSFDDSWDPLWTVKTTIHEKGWSAEMKIPLSQLRYSSKDDQVWGLQVSRTIHRLAEESMWQLIKRDAGGWVNYFGEMHGIKGIKPQKQLELYPYVVGKSLNYKKEEDNPFRPGSEWLGSAGIDGKLGITGNFTLDFTLNPDFGQVEADPSEVNLTTFETFFPEKRPFFIEGRNIYNYSITMGDGPLSLDNLFYSRRIGRSPHYYPEIDDGEYLDMPENTNIIGAAKVSGKTRNGLSVGILESVTSLERATIDTAGNRSRMDVEPLTNFFITRIKQDYNEGNTSLGGIITATNRDINAEHLKYLPSAAYTGGLDFSHTWKNKTYFFDAKFITSNIYGDSLSIIRTQSSGSRYFQRPDADHVTVDSTRTSLSGHGGQLDFGKTGNGHFSYLVWLTWRSPGLELNDIGYMRRADEIQQIGWVQYRIWEPFSIFRSFSINMNQWKGWDFGGTRLYDGMNTNLNLQFKNYWYFGGGLNHEFYGVSNFTLRGGPALKYPGNTNYWTYIQTDSRKKLMFSLNHWNNWGDKQQLNDVGVSVEVTYKPIKAMTISVIPRYYFSSDEMQYVDNVDYEGSTRYLLAHITQRTVSMSVRLNYNITPDLTIQYYGQPFLSSGEYDDFKKVMDPMADEYKDRFQVFENVNYDAENETFDIDDNGDGIYDYSIDNPDFNFLQFRSNLVARWEFVPGSTVYLVWSQNRTEMPSPHGFGFRKDTDYLFKSYPENIFLVKFTYCIKG